MQFNKIFLAVMLTILIGAAVVWSGYHKGWFDSAAETETAGAAEAATSDSENLADKVEKANKSLNKTFSGKETPISVTGGATIQGALVKRISSQGRVHSYRDTDIMTEIGGKITQLKIRDGMVVRKGQLLARIDDREYKLALATAEAKLLEAKANYYVETIGAENLKGSQEISPEAIKEQLKQLSKQRQEGLISEEDYRTKKLNLELKEIRAGGQSDKVLQARLLKSAEVEVERAKLNLEKCEVRAPYSGLIFQMELAPGQMVGAGVKLCRLTDLKDLVVKAQVLESEIGKVTVNRPAKITFTALPDLGDIQGEVQAVSPVVNSENKTVETIIRFRNVDDRIRPGMFADLKIDAEIFEDRLIVPKESVLPRDDRKVVFKVGEDNRAKWLYVETGEENDEYIEITGGKLAAGDVVLVDNHFTMGHDTLVKVKMKKGSAQAKKP